MPTELTWRKAIEKVLSEAPGAMHARDITEKIIKDGLRINLGATPAATVGSQLAVRVIKEGARCPFQRVGKGTFIWKGKVGTIGAAVQNEPSSDNEEDNEPQYDIVTSFGMFWRREYVDWNGNTKLLGKQRIEAEIVDFSKQVGIYLLYDGREVIYVGRATDRPLARRLFEHTNDRFSARWDRFSWFGMLPVNENGSLGDQRQADAI